VVAIDTNFAIDVQASARVGHFMTATAASAQFSSGSEAPQRLFDQAPLDDRTRNDGQVPVGFAASGEQDASCLRYGARTRERRI